MSFVEKEIRHLTGKAIHRFSMIQDGDRILAAVSGGHDSISMLWLLRDRLKRIPITYDFSAVHVELGFGNDTGKQLEQFFSVNGFDFCIINSTFGPRSHGRENRENPCFLCSRLRRKAIFQKAAELGCNKIAFGHHLDDVIETFFLNLYFAGSMSTILPCQELFDGRLTIIRPLYLVDSSTIKRYAEKVGFPVIESGCPTSRLSERAQIRSLLSSLYRTNRKIKRNIASALQNARGLGNGR